MQFQPDPEILQKRNFLHAGAPTTGQYTAEEGNVKYYLVPKNKKGGRASESARGRIFLQLLDYVDKLPTLPEHKESWLWSLIEIVFPGLPNQVIKEGGRVPEGVDFDETQAVYLVRGGDEAERMKQWRAKNNKGPTEDPGKDEFVPFLPAPMFDLLPRLTFDPTRTKANEWDIVVNLLGIVLFAIGKTPTTANLKAFTEKRWRAGINKSGRTEEQLPPSLANMYPGLPTFKAVQGYFNLNLKVRKTLVIELIGWTGAPGTVAQEIIATHVKLWKGMGMNHVAIIQDMIGNFSEELCKVKALNSELIRFQADLKKFNEEITSNPQYFKVINGDKIDHLHSRNYEELMKIAVQFERKQKNRMLLYAQKIENSTFYDEVFKTLTKTQKTDKKKKDMKKDDAGETSADEK